MKLSHEIGMMMVQEIAVMEAILKMYITMMTTIVTVIMMKETMIMLNNLESISPPS